MSKKNEIQDIKEKLKMICNKIEEVLIEYKEMKEKNNNIRTAKIFYNDSNSKINTINKLKQKTVSLQNSLENIYNISNINKIESEIKKKIKTVNKLKEEQILLSNFLKKQKKDIDNYSSKFTENKEILEIKNKLNLIKEEYRIKKESYTILNAKVKGQMSKIDILEKQINIIKQNIEYQKNKQKKEVEKSINNEEEENYDENNTEDNVESLENKEQMIIDEIIDEEKNFQNEIFQQNIIIENLKERFNKAIEYQIKIKEKKKKEINLKKIKLIKQKNNEKNTKIKYLNTNGKSLDYKSNINQTNKFNYKYGESPKNSKEINKIKISLNKKPFKEIKFNEIYKNIIGQNYNKNKRNENIYRSFYDRSLESNNENVIYGQKHKNKISNDIEKLKNEITNALKNNIVFFNSPKNTTDITHNINNEKLNEFEINKEFNIKNNSKPFQKFNFN